MTAIGTVKRVLRGTAIGFIALGVFFTVLVSPALAVTSPQKWSNCRNGFECAAVNVPVDYSAPDGEQVSVALIRAPARDRAERVGALVVNFGGPGDAGTDTLRLALETIPGVIRDRFDIVSFDPRGTGDTRGLDCIDDAATDVLAAVDPTPDDDAELGRAYTRVSSTIDFDGACVAKYGEWLAHVGTRNVARDVDRIRDALGERRLNFLGYSYGTVLGAVYAQEFPTRVRAMVLDSAVNLSAGIEEERLGNAAGFEHALNEFLDWCADRTECVFRNKGNPHAALTQLRDQFESGQTLPTRDGRRAGVATFYLGMVTALYNKTDGWPALAAGLQTAVNGDGSILQILADSYLGRDPNGHYSSLQDALGLIRCADAPTPVAEFPEFRATYEQYGRDYPWLGTFVAGSPIGCDPRLPGPASDELVGAVSVTNASPILIVGTTNDPATPYAGALDLQSRIAGSRLLTLESTQHGAYGQGVGCIDDAVNRYLITRKLPPENTRCTG